MLKGCCICFLLWNSLVSFLNSSSAVSNLIPLHTYTDVLIFATDCPTVRSGWRDLQGISVRRQGTVSGVSVKPACRNVRPWHHSGKKRSPELTFTFPDSLVGRCQGDVLALWPWRTNNILSQAQLYSWWGNSPWQMTQPSFGFKKQTKHQNWSKINQVYCGFACLPHIDAYLTEWSTFEKWVT